MNSYAELEVEENASPEEVKRAFRKLARRYHPDRNPGDESAAEKYKRVQAAYDDLMNRESKRNPLAAQILGHVTTLTASLIEQYALAGQSITNKDLLKELKAATRKSLEEVTGELKKLRSVRDGYASARGRFTKKTEVLSEVSVDEAKECPDVPEADLFDSVFATRIAHVETVMAAASERRSVLIGALVYLSRYVYSFDEKRTNKPTSSQTTWSTPTSGFTWSTF